VTATRRAGGSGCAPKRRSQRSFAASNTAREPSGMPHGRSYRRVRRHWREKSEQSGRMA
jgi:hypothetical protein